MREIKRNCEIKNETQEQITTLTRSEEIGGFAKVAAISLNLHSHTRPTAPNDIQLSRAQPVIFP